MLRKLTNRVVSFFFFSTFFIPPELICTNILWKHCKTWREEFLLYTKCFQFAFWLLQNTRLANISLLWDFKLITYFIYQIWVKQSLYATNLKHCGHLFCLCKIGIIFVFCKAENSIFSHSYFAAQTIWRKKLQVWSSLHKSVQTVPEKIISLCKKFLFSLSYFYVLGPLLNTLNKAFQGSNRHSVYCVSLVSWRIVAKW